MQDSRKVSCLNEAASEPPSVSLNLPQAFTVWVGVHSLSLQDSLICNMGNLKMPLSEMCARVWGDYPWKAPPYIYSKLSKKVCYYYGYNCSFCWFCCGCSYCSDCYYTVWSPHYSPQYFLSVSLILSHAPDKQATPHPLHLLEDSLPSYRCPCCEEAEQPLGGDVAVANLSRNRELG